MCGRDFAQCHQPTDWRDIGDFCVKFQQRTNTIFAVYAYLHLTSQLTHTHKLVACVCVVLCILSVMCCGRVAEQTSVQHLSFSPPQRHWPYFPTHVRFVAPWRHAQHVVLPPKPARCHSSLSLLVSSSARHPSCRPSLSASLYTQLVTAFWLDHEWIPKALFIMRSSRVCLCLYCGKTRYVEDASGKEGV